MNLKLAGCDELHLDGSFVSMKERPKDYDGTWDPTGIDYDLVDPVLLDFADRRRKMKEKYKGELFFMNSLVDSKVSFREFFLSDRAGIAKGVLNIQIRSVL